MIADRGEAPFEEAPPSAGRRMLSRGLGYTAASAGPKVLQIVTLPIYTRAMSAAEFGRLALAFAVTAAVIPLLTRGLDTAVFRGWYDLSDDSVDRRRFLSTTAVFLAVVPNVLALLLIAVAAPFTGQSEKLPTAYLALGLLSGSLFLTATIVPLAVLRAQDRIRDFIRVSLVLPAVSVPLTVVAVVFLDFGARGWLAANLIGALATMPFSFHAIRDQWTRRLSRNHLRGIIAWSVPLIPHGLSHWALVSSDRLVLARSASLSDLGVYNVGYQIGTVMGLLLTAFNNAVTPEYGRALKDDAHRARLPRMVTVQVAGVSTLGLAMALLAPPAITLLLAGEFEGAGEIVPWVTLGYVFFGFYLIPMNRIVILGGDVRYLWVGTSAAALTNIVLNLWLVPAGGILAAAVVTAVSYLVLLVAISLYARRSHAAQRGYEWGRLAAVLVLLAGVYALALVSSPSEPVLALAVRLAWIAGACAALVALDRALRRRADLTPAKPR